MHTDLGLRLSARQRALQCYFHHPSSNRVRCEPRTPEVGAEIVNERGIIKENKHGPQSQVVISAALAGTVIPQVCVSRGGCYGRALVRE